MSQVNGRDKSLSHRQETIKFVETTVFPEFLAKQMTRPDASEFRGVAIIDKFAAVFGAVQISVVSYSHLTDQHLDIAGHFLTPFLGLVLRFASSVTYYGSAHTDVLRDSLMYERILRYETPLPNTNLGIIFAKQGT